MDVILLIYGLVAGLVPALSVLYIKEKRIEPEKWRQDQRLKNLILKLEVHGNLLTLLKSGGIRVTRQSKTTKDQTHLLLFPEDLVKLNEIFGKYSYLLSEKLQDTYYEMVKTDKFFLDVSSTEQKISGRINSSNNERFKVDLKKTVTTATYCNLESMESIVKEQCDAFLKEYDGLLSPSK